MKLLLSLVLLFISINYLVVSFKLNKESKLLDEGKGDSKYILLDLYYNNTCSSNSFGSMIINNNYCNLAKSIECNKAEKLVYHKKWESGDCTGKVISFTTTPEDECAIIFGEPSKAICIDTVDEYLPSNGAVVSVYTDSCNNWNTSFSHITTVNTNTCIYNQPETFEVSCNSTSFTLKQYEGDSCLTNPSNIEAGPLNTKCNGQFFQYCLN